MSPTPAALPIAAAPPIAAYQGVRAAEGGRTIDRRNASSGRARSAQGHHAGAAPRNVQNVRTPAIHPPLPPAPPPEVPLALAVDDTHQEFCIAFIPHVVSTISGSA